MINHKTGGKMLGWMLFLCGVFLLHACGKEPLEQEFVPDREESGIAYVTVNPTYEELVVEKELDCTYRQSVQHDLSFGLSDYRIDFVNVKKGDMVEKGQLLASVDLGNLQEEVSELEYILACHQLELAQEKEKKEYELNAAYILFSYGKMEQKDKDALKEQQEEIERIYRDTIQDLEDQVELDKARVEDARELLEKGRIYAPAAGLVTAAFSLTVDAGWKTLEMDSMSVENETVISVSELEGCYFACSLTDYREYFEAGETYQIQAKEGESTIYYSVTPFNPESWETEGSMKFVLTDAAEVAQIGTKGKLLLNLGERQNALCVPSEAVHKTEKKDFVYVLEEGQRKMKYIETGLSGSGKTEVLSGLTKEDEIILNQAMSEESSGNSEKED